MRLKDLDSPQFTEQLKADIEQTLLHKSARDIAVIDMAGKSDVADYLVIATGTSTTHIDTLAEYVSRVFRDRGVTIISTEGKPQNEWVLVDTPYIVVHLFRPEFREQYRLEDMWQADFSPLHAIEETPQQLQPVS